jgi:hypothetical protein
MAAAPAAGMAMRRLEVGETTVGGGTRSAPKSKAA